MTGRSNCELSQVSSGEPKSLPYSKGCSSSPLLMRLVEHLRGFVVAQAREGRQDALQLFRIAPDDLQLGRAILEHALHDVRDEVLGQFHQAVEIAVGNFRLDHPELGEVAAGLRFFGAEGRPEAVDLAQRQRGRLDIELARLGEKRGIAEVVDREEGRGALAGCGRQDGRIGADESVAVEVLLRRAHDLGANAQNGRLARRAHPQVAALHEEIDAVFFGRDGIRVGLRHALDDLDIFDIEFKAAGRAFVGAHFAGDDDAGLLRESFECLEDFWRHALDVRHALHCAGAIAKDGEEQLAALARVIEPSVDGDGLAFMLSQGGDGGDGSGRLVVLSAGVLAADVSSGMIGTLL